MCGAWMLRLESFLTTIFRKSLVVSEASAVVCGEESRTRRADSGGAALTATLSEWWIPHYPKVKKSNYTKYRSLGSFLTMRSTMNAATRGPAVSMPIASRDCNWIRANGHFTYFRSKRIFETSICSRHATEGSRDCGSVTRIRE